MFSSTDRVD